jgi:hypothetical protein
VVEQVQSSSNSSDLSEEEEENSKYVNIIEQLIKTSKHRRIPKRPKRLKWQKRPRR